MAIAEHAPQRQETNTQGTTPHYPSSDEVFAGFENIDPKLVASYEALTTTSRLRRRDPQILSEIVFQEEIENKSITPKGAHIKFGGLSRRLEDFLARQGIRIVRERYPGRGALAHLEEDPELITMVMREFIPDIEFPSPAEFPLPRDVMRAIKEQTNEGTRLRDIASTVLGDYIHGRTTKKEALLESVFPEMTPADANNNFLANRHDLNTRLSRNHIGLARIESGEKRNGAEYTFIKVDGELVPVGKRVKRNTPDTPKTGGRRKRIVTEGPNMEQTQDLQILDESPTSSDQHRTEPADFAGTNRDQKPAAVVLRPGEESFVEKLTALRAEIEQAEEQEEDLNEIDHGEVATHEPEEESGTPLAEGIEVSLSPTIPEQEAIPHPDSVLENTSQEELQEVEHDIEEERKYTFLSDRQITLITALFSEERSRISAADIARALNPDRKIKTKHEQDAAIAIQILNHGILSGLNIQVDGNLKNGFKLVTPEGWGIEMILEHIDQAVSKTQPAQEVAVRKTEAPTIPKPSPDPVQVEPPRGQNSNNPIPYEEAFAQIGKDANRDPDLPVLKINPKTFEWEFDGKKGKFPYGAELDVILKLNGRRDGATRQELAGKEDPTLAEKNFGNLQKMLDDPDNPTVFIRTGSGRFTTFKMSANIELMK